MFAILVWSLVTAQAHKPYYDGNWTTAESAYEVEDPDISIVVYHQVRCNKPELWLTFEANPSEDVWVQLGTPLIERLTDYRPSMAVLGPGLPALGADDVPFEVPEGLGGIVYPSDEAYVFDEPFTQTSSFILAEDWVTMPEAGTAYLVAWDPDNQTGKLWLAMGVVEDFSDVGFDQFGEWDVAVNNFHETGKHEPVPDIEERICEDKDLTAEPEEAEVELSGCNTMPAPAGGWWWLAGAALWMRRRD